MASPNNHSQEPPSPPAVPTHSTISRVYDFEVPQPTIQQVGDSPAQLSFDATVRSSPVPQSCYSDTRSSSTSTNDKPLSICRMLIFGTMYYSIANKLEWRCKYCSKRYILNGGTRLIKIHLKSDHDISELSVRQERSLKRQLSIQDALITAISNPQKRRRFSGELIRVNIGIK
jgi:hypothetical protein